MVSHKLVVVFLLALTFCCRTISSYPNFYNPSQRYFRTHYNIRCQSQKDWFLILEFVDRYGDKDGLLLRKCIRRKLGDINDIKIYPTHVKIVHNCVSGYQRNMTFTDIFRPEYNFFIDNRGRYA
ncbi:unnamed protein product [Caenorhabditis angaria]|uniref:Uncharacterized protein n=1 Tax=Caenorhabditis angaria TaxID=860376 RepID=A0A9P1J6Q4_9PELO|nr:unnamed protein product [Caenorhabditis angaria]